MTDNLTDFLDMNDLDNDHIRALIDHYLSLKHRMPDNITVRERLLELEREQFNRERQQPKTNNQ